MAEPCKVGIVTVTYNSAEVLPGFLESLWKQTHGNFVLYAVDNASKDTTLEQLRAERDCRIRVEASESNVGVAEGNNIGIRLALQDGCDAVLLINNDVLFPSNLVETLLESLATNRCDMVAPKIRYFEPANTIWWAGGHFQPAFGYRAVHRGLDQIDNDQFNEPVRVAYSPTCCVLIKREVFATIGLMDAKYFVYCDDSDFMLRAHKADLTLIYEPTALLIHKVSSLTKGTDSPFGTHLLARNRIYFWIKHLGMPLACLNMVALIAIYLIRYCFQKKQGSVLRIQLKAMLDGFRLA